METPVIPIYAYTPGVSGPPQGRWTHADWEQLPDDGSRYEVIEGILYVSTAPSFFHQWIIQQLYDLVGLPAKQRGLAFPITAPIGVFMPGCEPVQPDFVLVLAENASIIHDRRIWGVPDLIVEVLSPGSGDYDEKIKLVAYAKAGVPEYGVIDPAERELRLYRLESPGQYAAPLVSREPDTVRFRCLPGISFPLKTLFEGSPDTTL